MTPLQLQMILHYHTRTTPYAAHEPEHAGSEGVRSQRQLLIDDGLLKWHSGFSFSLTAKGIAFIDALCAMPLPRESWSVEHSWRSA